MKRVCSRFGLILVGGFLSALLAQASWTVDMSAAAAHLGGQSTYTFSTLAEAQAFVDANRNYGAKLIPGGSDDGASSGSGTAGGSLPSANSSGYTMQQKMALAAAQAAMPALQNAVHDLFYGSPQDQAKQQQLQLEQQARTQLELAAQQLSNTGLWYMRQKNYANAIVEFQQALGKTPWDPAISSNLALAKQLLSKSISDRATALQTSGALGQLLGTEIGSPTSAGGASPLNLVNLNTDTNLVDLRGTTKSFIDPASLKAASKAALSERPVTQQELDSQFDKLMIESGSESRPITQQELDAQFDKLMVQSDMENLQARQSLDAKFDKAYNEAALKALAVTPSDNPAPQSHDEKKPVVVKANRTVSTDGDDTPAPPAVLANQMPAPSK